MPAHLNAPVYFSLSGWIGGSTAQALLDQNQAVRAADGWAIASSVRIFNRDGLNITLPVSAVLSWVDGFIGCGAEISRARWQTMTGHRSRQPIQGIRFDRAAIMGVLNVTPDSFSDGGDHESHQAAVSAARSMIEAGANIIDMGGESTRPGADPVSHQDEWQRVSDVVSDVAQIACVSIDTRHADTAERAVAAGAVWINDVMAGQGPGMLAVMARSGVPVVLMHSMGKPKTMQEDPHYDHVVMDVFDTLQQRIDAAISAGVARDRILIDPGIGFGKTFEHNLTLIRHLSCFHALGCPILFGASRKSLINSISRAPVAKDRLSGSLFLAIEAVKQGCQVVRVHDVFETRQALDMYEAMYVASGSD